MLNLEWRCWTEPQLKVLPTLITDDSKKTPLCSCGPKAPGKRGMNLYLNYSGLEVLYTIALCLKRSLGRDLLPYPKFGSRLHLLSLTSGEMSQVTTRLPPSLFFIIIKSVSYA